MVTNATPTSIPAVFTTTLTPSFCPADFRRKNAPDPEPPHAHHSHLNHCHTTKHVRSRAFPRHNFGIPTTIAQSYVLIMMGNDIEATWRCARTWCYKSRHVSGTAPGKMYVKCARQHPNGACHGYCRATTLAAATKLCSWKTTLTFNAVTTCGEDSHSRTRT